MGVEAQSAEKVSLFWGAWDMWNGSWHPNPYITMSRDEQHRQNMEAGYSCIHERMPTLCPVCKSTQSTRSVTTTGERS